MSLPTSKVNLVIQTAFLGDLLLSVPLLKNIKRLYPNEKIVLVCRSGIGALLHKVGLVDAVYEVVKGDQKSYSELTKSLKKLTIHNIFCPHESLRSALLVQSLKADNKIGFKKWWNRIIFNKRVDRPKELPDALRQLALMQPFSDAIKTNMASVSGKELLTKLNTNKLSDIPSWAESSLKSFFLSAPAPQEFDFLQNGKKLVLIFPGSVWATKRWTLQGFRELGTQLEEKGYQVCWMGSSIEKVLCEELNKDLKNGIVLAGQTSIFETCWIMARAQLVIGNDSSSSHMASLTDTPVIAIFGPTVLDFGYRPWSNNAFIAEAELFCRPCGPHGHMECPRHTHDCMKLVTTSQVMRIAHTIL